MTPGQLVEHLPILKSGLSRHLKELESYGLISKRREKNNLYYSVREQGLKKLHKEYITLLGASFDSMLSLRGGE